MQSKKIIDYLIFFTLFINFLVFCISTYELFILKTNNNKGFFLYLLIISFFSLFFFIFLQKISNYKLKIRIILLISIFSFLIVGLETYLIFSKRNELQNKLILENKNYDKRTAFELYNDLKKEGLNVEFPQIPSHFINSNGIAYKNKKILPLGTISNSYTFFYNLEGFYPIIKTDKYGFNNPNQIYEKKIDILLVGGSHGEGYSVQNNQTLSSQLRNYNYNVMNLSRAHNGALLKLASLQEYGSEIKPKIVFWLYYEYDLRYLFSELKSPTLVNYLEQNNFSQNLKNRQSEIDQAYKKYLIKNYKYEES